MVSDDLIDHDAVETDLDAVSGELKGYGGVMSDDLYEQITIEQQARIDRWCDMRAEVRQGLIRVLLLGSFYLLLSLSMGAFLIKMMESVGREMRYFEGYLSYPPRELDVSWMSNVIGFYIVVMIISVLSSFVLILFLINRLPSRLCSWLMEVPVLGPVAQCLSGAELCQSIYVSVNNSSPFSESLARAATEVQSPAIKNWATLSASQVKAGGSLALALSNLPIKAPPLAILSAAFSGHQQVGKMNQLWESTAEDFHTLAMSRLKRAEILTSNVILLISAFFASYAIYLSSTFLQAAMKGFWY